MRSTPVVRSGFARLRRRFACGTGGAMITASQLQDLMVAALIRQAGGTQRRWRMAIGSVKLLDPERYAHCNWSITPAGTPRENAAIERLLDTLRLDHPIVTPG
jgi:hypothetical protein